VFSEDVALARFKEVRWKHGAFCPHCGSSQVYHFSDHRTHKCGECRQRFSIKVGTIFEDSKVGLASWFLAVQLATENPHGVTPPELAQRIGVSRKTATLMLKRLRQAAQTPSFKRPLEAAIPGQGDQVRYEAKMIAPDPVAETQSDRQARQAWGGEG